MRDHHPVSGRIYSVGYEGFTVDALVERLAQSGVSLLVDVRLNATSRRPGFSRRALESALAGHGIVYVHERKLGNPPDNRDAFRRGDGKTGRVRMRALLENGSGGALERLVERAQGARIAVMCVERERNRCHRDVITEMAQERDPSIEVLQIL